MVETMEAPATLTVKILRGQRSWPALVEVACALVVGEEDLLARAQSLCHTYALWERQGQQPRRLQQAPHDHQGSVALTITVCPGQGRRASHRVWTKRCGLL